MAKNQGVLARKQATCNGRVHGQVHCALLFWQLLLQVKNSHIFQKQNELLATNLQWSQTWMNLYSTAHSELKRKSRVTRECQTLDSPGRGLEYEYSNAWVFEGSCKRSKVASVRGLNTPVIVEECLCKQLLRVQHLPWPHVYSLA